MSALACLIHRHGAAVNAAPFTPIMDRLSHRAIHGSHSFTINEGVFGCHLLTPTPEQPLHQHPFVIMMDGWLANREERLQALGLPATTADIAIALHSYKKEGKRGLTRLQGSFAIILYDKDKHETVVIRDALGDRTIYYHANAQHIIIASEPYAILSHPDASDSINELGIVEYLGIYVPSQAGTTMFTDVRELPAGHILSVGAATSALEQYWNPVNIKPIKYRHEQDYVEHFKTLLEQAIAPTLQNEARIGLLMSGGYDSTTVGAIAYKILAEQNRKLHTLSLVYDELTSCDERRYIYPFLEKFAVESLFVQGDNLWPLKDMHTYPSTPNEPDRSVYRLLKINWYNTVKEQGIDILLTGGFGNQLFALTRFWLADAIRDGHVGIATKGLNDMVKSQGLTETLTGNSMQWAAASFLDWVPGGRKVRPRRPIPLPDWLTPYSKQILYDNGYPLSKESKRVESYETLFGEYTTRGYSHEYAFSEQAGVDIRYPLHNQRLAEFMIAIPGYMHNRGTRYKYLMNKAMQGTLPDIILNRRSFTSQTPLFTRGMRRETATLKQQLTQYRSWWSDYVDADYVDRQMASPEIYSQDKVETLVPWQCINVSTWYDQHIHSSRSSS